MNFPNKQSKNNTGAADKAIHKMNAFKPRGLVLRLFHSVIFLLCKVQEVDDKLNEAVSGGKGWTVTLRESEGISYRDEEMLLNRVRGLSEWNELPLTRNVS